MPNDNGIGAGFRRVGPDTLRLTVYDTWGAGEICRVDYTNEQAAQLALKLLEAMSQIYVENPHG